MTPHPDYIPTAEAQLRALYPHCVVSVKVHESKSAGYSNVCVFVSRDNTRISTLRPDAEIATLDAVPALVAHVVDLMRG